MRIECILLAAGFSRRFGANKLLQTVEGRPLWERTLDAIQSVYVNKNIQIGITVVTQWPEVRQECARKKVRCAVNPSPQNGISSSIRVGLQAAPAADCYAFFVADQPGLEGAAVGGFLAAFAASGAPLGAMAAGGEPGNPCVFAAEFCPELMALQGDTGGKRVLRAHLDRAFLYPVPPEMLRDLDFPADIEGNLPK